MITPADERIAAAELDHLARSLRPPCQAGPYTLSGQLARSATALLYTARGPVFGGGEGVLKLTGCMYAPILDRELGLLSRCADAEIEGVVRPLVRHVVWISIGGPAADRPAAAVALPLLSGGDLSVVAARAARAGNLGPHLALEAARPVAVALGGMQTLLDPPLVHGDVRPQNVLLPTPTSEVRELQLIDLDAAREFLAAPDAAREDVRGFGELLCLLSTGSSDTPPMTHNKAFDECVNRCVATRYASMRDEDLWHDLQRAEEVERARQGHARRFNPTRWLEGVRRLAHQ
jgi:hypothetical protein